MFIMLKCHAFLG